jgi:hypothetical protein
MASTITWPHVTAPQTSTIPGQRISPFAEGAARPQRRCSVSPTASPHVSTPADHDSVLYVRRDPGALGAYFADMRKVGDVGEDMHAYLLTGQRQSWDEIWPQVRILTVS